MSGKAKPVFVTTRVGGESGVVTSTGDLDSWR